MTLLALVCASACQDLPTAPGALQQLAGGKEWVAVPAPAVAAHAQALRQGTTSGAPTPESVAVESALHAIQEWSDRVRRQVRVDGPSQMATSLALVEQSRTAALQALAAGDTAAAVQSTLRAAEEIGAHTPFAVAHRVLVRAEARLAAQPTRGSATARAQHLLRSARHELGRGDALRALRRALYALQLAEGNEVPLEPADSAPRGAGEREVERWPRIR